MSLKRFESTQAVMMNAPRYLYAATAEARLRAANDKKADKSLRRTLPELLELLDRGEALQTARVAGVMAARRGGEWLAYTAQAELTAVEIDFQWRDGALSICATCEGFSRANLGARALLAASVCAVALVDMRPEHAEHLVVDGARIVEQKGGPQPRAYDFEPPLRAAILVTSDAVIAGHKEDRAGATVREALEKMAPLGVRLVEARVIGDDAAQIAGALQAWVDDRIDLVLTVGGTGLAHTDMTVETVESMLDRPIPGLMEASRAYGQSLTPHAFMSRGVAGLVDDTLVLTLPGSRGGARESCEALFPVVLHVFKTLRKSRALL